MGDKSAIEWTDATWNPIVGCSIVSPGCTNCYAMRVADRMGAISVAHESAHGGDPGPLLVYRGLTRKSRAGPVWTGKVAVNERVIAAPLRWKRPRRIFVNSMSDLFHESVSDGTIDRVFAVMALAPRHTFQVLTKRAERMREYLRTGALFRVWDQADRIAYHRNLTAARPSEVGPAAGEWPLRNVWLGCSVEDQARADERVPLLLDTPAAVRFVSAEPLLGAVDLPWLREGRTRPDWVIVGGESGPGARPMHPDWARSIRDQCIAARVPFFFKQWGAWLPGQNDRYPSDSEPQYGVAHWQDGAWGARSAPPPAAKNYVMWSPDGSAHAGGSRSLDNCFPVHAWAARVGKKRAGRLLDGREWNEMPKARPHPGLGQVGSVASAPANPQAGEEAPP